MTTENPILTMFSEQIKHRGFDDAFDAMMDWLDHADETQPACIERGYTNEMLASARDSILEMGLNGGD